MRRRVDRHFVQYLPANAVPALAGLVALPVLTRLLGPEEFGRLTLVLAAVAAGRVLLQWVGATVVRFYSAANPAGEVGWLRAALWIHLPLNLLLCAVAWGVTRAVAPAAEAGLAASGTLLLFGRNSYTLLSHFLRAQLRPKYFTRFIVWESAGGLLAGVALAATVDARATAVIAGYAIAGFAALPMLWSRAVPRGVLGGAPDPALIRRMVAFGWPITVSNISQWTVRRIDRLQIQWWHGPTAVGFYSVPSMVAHNSILLLSTALRNSSLPLLASTWESAGREPALAMLRSVTRMYLLAGFPMVAGITFLAKPIVEVVAGGNFTDPGGAIVPWVAAAAFLGGLRQRYQNGLALSQRTDLIMYCIGAGALLTVALNWLLLPRFDFSVAAITNFVAHAAMTLAMASASRSVAAWPFPWLSAGRIAGATALMWMALTGLTHLTGPLSAIAQISIGVPAGVLAYAAGLWPLGESGPGEWAPALASVIGGGSNRSNEPSQRS